MNSSPAIDTKLMKALSHPLRQRILIGLNKRVASPSELAEEIGEPLGNVSYHVRMLVDLDAIELVGTTPRRGALEHHYRAKVRPVFDDETYASFPIATRRALMGDVLKEIWQSVGDAADAGAFDEEDVHASRSPLVLDTKGRAEVAELLIETFERVQEISSASSDRLTKADDESERTDTWLAILHYGATEPPVELPRPKPKPKAKRRKPAAKKR